MQNSHLIAQKYGLITNDLFIKSKINSDLVLVIDSPKQFNKIISDKNHFRVLAADYSLLNQSNEWQLVGSYDQLLFIFENAEIQPFDFNKTIPHKSILKNKFEYELFIELEQLIAEQEQNVLYLNMATELNAEYEIIKSELEAKLDETKSDLLTSRQKILDTNLRTEAMRKILFSITQESDIYRIETILNDQLPASSKATWIKIISHDQKDKFETELSQQLNTTFKSYSLPEHFILFIKGDQKLFKKDDLNLFSKIRDIIEINYNREVNYHNLIRTENIVRTAFEEFNHPLAVIDIEYNVIQSNHVFNKNMSDKKLCYEILFNRIKPCLNCHLGTKYTTEVDGKIFDVDSNSMTIDGHSKKLWINLYKNKTEEHYFEQRLNQTSKMKELGIISSSIAHELNNPIGGVLSYLQLIQMDLSKDHVLNNDIKNMIETTLRMKKIIEDLLIFSRKSIIHDQGNNNLLTSLQESLSIHDIQFKNENIKIINQLTDQNINLKFSKTAFRDALHFIFNFYIEKIKYFRKINSQKTGLVEVKFSTLTSDESSSLSYCLEFQGNCGNIDEAEKSKDISLLALSKCLTDQDMHVEIAAPKENWISLKVIIQKS